MQKYDFTAPSSGASQTINAPGRYLKYVSGSAGGNDASIILTPGGKPGSKIILYPGQAITLPHDAAIPSAWTIANAQGAAQISGTVVVGNGRVDDNTLQGVVQVVDGGKARTLAGNAFSGALYVGGVSAKYPAVQLWNPASNTNRAVIEQVSGGSGVASAWRLVLDQLVITTDVTATSIGSKKSGGTASTMLAKIDNLAGVPAGALMEMNFVQAASSSIWTPKEPIVLLPGWGAKLFSVTAAADVLGCFEWYEEPNV